MFKKVLSIGMALCLLCSLLPCVSAEEGGTAEYIIKLSTPPLYAQETQTVSTFSAQQAVSEADRREAIIAEQNSLLTQIAGLGEVQTFSLEPAVAEPLYRYTNVFNGFALSLTAEQAEEIRQLDGVESVIKSAILTPPEPRLTDSTDVIGADQIAGETPGYTGEGQAIAVLDGSFDVTHPFFVSPDDTETVAITRDAYETITDTDGIVTVDRYYNAKIPFAYDYAGATGTSGDSDVTYVSDSHGTHVAGIVAGKGIGTGEGGNGADYSGVAPEAQLILMKVFPDGGSGSYGPVIAALDDVALFKGKVSAVNMSLGTDYVPAIPGYKDFETIFANLNDLGIVVNCAAGNIGRGYKEKDGEKLHHDTPVTLPDYGAQGIPAYYEGAFSVAASTKEGKMADFSSWGVDYDLNLKPEITAPGQTIYSSVPGDTYEAKSGTSMATPHISGATALVNGYVTDNFPTVTGEAKSLLMKRLMMSTATPLEHSTGVLASPRQQGAGQLNLPAALATKVVLYGGDGTTAPATTKINLGDDIENSFILSFTAENLTNETVTYDTIEVTVLTDGYKTVEDKHYVDGTKELKATLENAEAVTVSAKSTQNVTLNVTMDTDELNNQAAIYKNGFYLDGFVTLKDSTGTEPELHIPFAGFRGNWEAVPKLDRPLQDEENAYYEKTGLFSTLSDGSLNPLGNNYRAEDWPQECHAAISPNGDGVMDTLSVNYMLLGTATEVKVEIENVADTTETETYMPKYTPDSVTYPRTDAEKDLLNDLGDGEYTVKISALNSYDENTTPEILTLPFTIDREVPRITKIREYMEGTSKKLAVTASDNHYLMSIFLEDTEGNEIDEKIQSYAGTAEGASYEAVFDITGLTAYEVCAVDYAGNEVSTKDFPVQAAVTRVDETNYSFSFTGTGEMAETVQVIPAVYAADGRLICVGAPTQLEIPAVGGAAVSKSWTFSAAVPENAVLKIFYWENMTAIKPAFSMPTAEKIINPPTV